MLNDESVRTLLIAEIRYHESILFGRLGGIRTRPLDRWTLIHLDMQALTKLANELRNRALGLSE